MFKKLFKKPSKAEISETVTSASTIPSPNKSTHTNQAEPGQTAPPLQRRVSKHENYELTKAASTPLLPRTPVTSASTIPSPNKSTHTNQAEPGQTAPPLQRRVSKHENYELTKAASTPLLPRTPVRAKSPTDFSIQSTLIMLTTFCKASMPRTKQESGT
ncbi:hypothetical protein DPMN_144314 [Dreissena polymorpha]|uniref:Uncharacterized protein n=1 Tax=Dreissena polymorpha TaxID=45954 RepID=A0A9D4GFD7_DREPO|nr:hypothetical protein DPMN_144314 [Dreissena polymorpha]